MEVGLDLVLDGGDLVGLGLAGGDLVGLLDGVELARVNSAGILAEVELFGTLDGLDLTEIN